MGDGEKEYRVTGFFQYKSKSTDASNYSVICSNAYLKSRLSMDEISKIVYIRIANSSGMSSQALEDAIFKVAERHGISRSNVATSALYFNAIKPIDANNLLITIGVAVMVAFAATLVIYSIFFISVTGKVREYGQLRTIGTTQKQIKKIVFGEGCHLSAAGIPLGILVSCIIAFLAIPKGWNSATTLGVCLAVAIITFIVVIFAIRRPMKIAACTSPVEAIRYSAASDSTKAIKTKKLHRKITPIRLAFMNFFRNRKKSILTLLSLGFSGILLMCAASFSNSVPIEGMARGDFFNYGQFHLSLSSGNSDNSDGYAVSRIQQNNPLDEALKKHILSIDGVTGIQTEKLTKVHYFVPNGSRNEAWASGFSKSEANSLCSSLKSGTCDYDTYRNQNGIIVAAASAFKKVCGQEPTVGEKIKLEFYTADGIIKKEYTVLGVTDNRFKDPVIGFEHTWADEDIGQNCGRFSYDGGERTEEYTPETDAKAVDFACKAWNYDPKDMDLYLNSTGSKYICIESSDYQPIELLGKPALFTNERLTDEGIPQGLYCYHLREGDDGSFCSVEPKVSVNHGGSVITDEPIDFGEQGYVSFTDDTSPNFLGEELTLG